MGSRGGGDRQEAFNLKWEPERLDPFVTGSLVFTDLLASLGNK